MRHTAFTLILALSLMATGASCRGSAEEKTGAPASSRFEVQTIDDAALGALRQAFDAAHDQARYVIALSPT